MKKIFLDCDVILDVSLERENHFDDSFRVISLIDKGFASGFTSTHIIANVYYHTSKMFGHKETLEFLNDLDKILTVLDVRRTMLRLALTSDFTDFEDAIQHFCAIENNIDCIITRNTKDYSKSQIPVYTPTDFLCSVNPPD